MGGEVSREEAISSAKKQALRTGRIEAKTGRLAERDINVLDDWMKTKFKHGVNYNMKIVIRGASGTGKTQLFRRLQGKPFEATHNPTPGIQSANIHWSYKENPEVIKVEVWDVVDKGFTQASRAEILKKKAKNLFLGRSSPIPETEMIADASTVNVYRGCHAVIFLFDITRKDTWDYIVNEMPQVPKQCHIAILANYYDMHEYRQVSRTDINNLVRQYTKGRKKAQMDGRVYTLNTSMKDCFGLSQMYNYLNIPFLYLKVQAMEETVRRLYDEINKEDDTFSIMADTQDYQAYITMRQGVLPEGHPGDSPPPQNTAQRRHSLDDAYEELAAPERQRGGGASRRSGTVPAHHSEWEALESDPGTETQSESEEEEVSPRKGKGKGKGKAAAKKGKETKKGKGKKEETPAKGKGKGKAKKEEPKPKASGGSNFMGNMDEMNDWLASGTEEEDPPDDESEKSSEEEDKLPQKKSLRDRFAVESSDEDEEDDIPDPMARFGMAASSPKTPKSGSTKTATPKSNSSKKAKHTPPPAPVEPPPEEDEEEEEEEEKPEPGGFSAMAPFGGGGFGSGFKKTPAASPKTQTDKFAADREEKEAQLVKDMGDVVAGTSAAPLDDFFDDDSDDAEEPVDDFESADEEEAPAPRKRGLSGLIDNPELEPEINMTRVRAASKASAASKTSSQQRREDDFYGDEGDEAEEPQQPEEEEEEEDHEPTESPTLHFNDTPQPPQAEKAPAANVSSAAAQAVLAAEAAMAAMLEEQARQQEEDERLRKEEKERRRAERKAQREAEGGDDKKGKKKKKKEKGDDDDGDKKKKKKKKDKGDGDEKKKKKGKKDKGKKKAKEVEEVEEEEEDSD